MRVSPLPLNQAGDKLFSTSNLHGLSDLAVRRKSRCECRHLIRSLPAYSGVVGIPLSFSPLFMRLWIEWSVEDRHRGSPRFGRFRHLRNAFNDAWHNGRRSDGIDE